MRQMMDAIVKQMSPRKLLTLGAVFLLSNTCAFYTSSTQPALTNHVIDFICRVADFIYHATTALYQGIALMQLHRVYVRATGRLSNSSRRDLGV
jgi:hypothetical protein